MNELLALHRCEKSVFTPMPESSYLSAAMTNVPPDQRAAFFSRYETIAEIAAGVPIKTFLPHLEGIAIYPRVADGQLDVESARRQIREMCEEHIEHTDLVIIDASIPEIGVGIEAESADRASKPIFVLVQQGVPVPEILTEKDNVVGPPIEYYPKNDADLRNKLTWSLHQFASIRNLLNILRKSEDGNRNNLDYPREICAAIKSLIPDSWRNYFNQLGFLNTYVESNVLPGLLPWIDNFCYSL